MCIINARGLDFKALNESIRASREDVLITDCLGQRFIAAGLDDKRIDICGTPGNALGAYLNGAHVSVLGSAQDAVGDTMNAGKIVVHGNIGDAAGYAMRGGSIYVRGDAGYRAGIHMKEYKDKRPVMVIGGRCGSFLGEYQAGGVIIVLGLNIGGKNIVGNFPCTGMHGGKMYLRTDVQNMRLPGNVSARAATDDDMRDIDEYLTEFCALFEYDKQIIARAPFLVIAPDGNNPYTQMYVAN